MTKVPPTLPALRVELGLSLVESAFIVTTFNVLGMLVGMIAGMLGDRFGRKRLSLAGLGLMAVGGGFGAAVAISARRPRCRAPPWNIAMAVLFACYVAQWTSVMVWLPTFLTEHGASTAGASVATALMVLVNVPGNLLGGWLLSRGVPRSRLVIAAALIAAVCEIGMLPSALPGDARFLLVLVFSFFSALMPASIFAGL